MDHEGEALESYVTRTRDKAAALTFIRKAMKRPTVVRKPLSLTGFRHIARR
jgi:transposase-like protein